MITKFEDGAPVERALLKTFPVSYTPGWMQNLLDNLSEAAAIADSELQIKQVNAALIQRLGESPRKLLGKHISRVWGEPYDYALCNAIWEQMRSHGLWKYKVHVLENTANTALADSRVVLIGDAGATEHHYLVLLGTEFRQTNRDPPFLTETDHLTGLPSMEVFEAALENAMKRSLADGKILALLYIDINRFSLLVQTFGKEIGDKVIFETARHIQAAHEKVGIVARIGIDEFVAMLYPFNSIDEIETVCQAVHQSIAMVAPNPDEEPITVRARIGVSFFPQTSAHAGDLIREAFTAAFIAKNEHSYGLHFYNETFNAEARRRVILETRFRQGLKNKAFSLAYQAQIETESNTIVGVEALIRWNDAVLGEIKPSELIELAEATDLIDELTDWIIEKACEETLEWISAEGKPLSVAINVSATSLRRSFLFESIVRAIRKYGFQPGRLIIELTETQLMSQGIDSMGQLEKLETLGVKLAIDDFGTGYSSLAYLKQIPLDIVKIDRSFVSDVDADHNDYTIVSTLIQLSHSLNCVVVAEGVETKTQYEILRKEHCDIVQGFLLGKPVGRFEMERYLMESVSVY